MKGRRKGEMLMSSQQDERRKGWRGMLVSAQQKAKLAENIQIYYEEKWIFPSEGKFANSSFLFLLPWSMLWRCSKTLGGSGELFSEDSARGLSGTCHQQTAQSNIVS